MRDATPDAHPNVRSSRYFIVESRMRCDLCNVVTAVFGLALPADYESLYVNDDAPDDESGTWESPGFAAVLSYVDYLQDEGVRVPGSGGHEFPQLPERPRLPLVRIAATY